MWYEIIPSALGVLAAFTAANYSVYVTNRLFLGQAFKRHLGEDFEYHYYLRDCRVTNRKDPYVFIGLDGIPDKEEGK